MSNYDPSQLFLFSVIALGCVIVGILLHKVYMAVRSLVQYEIARSKAKTRARTLLIEARRASLNGPRDSAVIIKDLDHLMQKHDLTVADLGKDASREELNRLGNTVFVGSPWAPESHCSGTRPKFPNAVSLPPAVAALPNIVIADATTQQRK